LVENLHLAGSGTDLNRPWPSAFGGAKELDLRLDRLRQHGAVEVAQPQNPGARTLGVNLNAAVRSRSPCCKDVLEVRNTYVSHNDFPSGLSDLNGVLLFDSDRIQIESLGGTTGAAQWR